MAISGFFFLLWRFWEIVLLIPIVGMLAWFVHQYVHANLLTPDYILVLFIVSVIALAWAVFTTIDYLRARHDAFFVALFDLGIVGALIAGVYYLRFIANENCSSVSGGFGDGGVYLDAQVNKQCAMLKASFALAIICILLFFMTFLFALLVARHYRDDDRRVVVKREYRTSSRGGTVRRSGSRDYRGSREYDRGYRGGSRRSQYSSRRSAYV